MNGRALLILLTGIVFLSGTTFLQLYERGKDISANVDRTYTCETAQNIAESGVGIGMRKIADDPTWRTGIPLMDLLGGKASITAVDTTYLGNPAIMVTCAGIMDYGRPSEWRETSIAFVYGDTIPGIIQGTITTTHDLDQDPGFGVDGREHDKDGTCTGHDGEGRKAVWTEKTCSEKSPGTMYGSDDITHHDGNYAQDQSIVADHQSHNGGFPHSADSIMSTCGAHFEEGSLKSAAKSGIHGSQYATDPSTLTYPLKSLTYVELPQAGTWSNANVTGSGVLVIHNCTNDARAKGLSTPYKKDQFTGIIIADEIDRIECTIVGAVITMGSQPDTIASGKGCILYSGHAIRESTGEVLRTIKTNGSRESAVAWKQ